MEEYKKIKNKYYKEFLKDLKNKIDKVNMSYIETDFIKEIVTDKTGYLFPEFYENYKDDGIILISGLSYNVEFKRMHDYEKNKNIFKIRKFFHVKSLDVIWVEYSEEFNWITFYDLNEITKKVNYKINGDTLETEEDVDPFLILEV